MFQNLIKLSQQKRFGLPLRICLWFKLCIDICKTLYDMKLSIFTAKFRLRISKNKLFMYPILFLFNLTEANPRVRACVNRNLGKPGFSRTQSPISCLLRRPWFSETISREFSRPYQPSTYKLTKIGLEHVGPLLTTQR